MEQSQRRTTGQEAPGSGHRLKLIAALGLSASIAGFFAYGPAVPTASQPAGQRAVSACDYELYAQTESSSACATDVTGIPTSPPTEIASLADANKTMAATAEPDPRIRQETVTRAWNDNQANLVTPRPGYTMTELCSAGLDSNVLQCQKGNYDRHFIAAKAGVTADVESGLSISGQVLNPEGEGLEDITIIASPERFKQEHVVAAGETLRFWTVTDALGAYSLNGLPDGEYTIRTRARGPYQAARISARAGVDYADLVLARNTQAVAKGQVLTADGAPLEGVTVLPVLPGQPSVLTGDDGHFELPVSLKPTVQRFALRFQRPGFREHSDQVSIKQGTATLEQTASISAIRVIMHPVEAWTEVSGIVYSDEGEPLPGRTVELSPRSAQQKFTTVTDKDGQYSFPFVESGADYRLSVFGGMGYRDYRQSLRLNNDTTELDVSLEAYEFGELSGRLVNLNGAPVPDFDLMLRNTGSSKPNAVVSTDARGNFVITDAPAGDFVVASQSTPSILVRGLHLDPGESLHVPLVLDWGEHEIRGSVVDANNNPVPASRIILQWSHQVDGVTTNSTRRTAANTQGHFAFSNLGPGPHSLRIDAPGHPTKAVEHDLSRQGYDLTVRLN